MLLAKYKKEGDARYLSQVDVQRVLQRAFRRAALCPAYSNGFHPHMRLKTSPPAPLGLASTAEYFVLELETSTAPDEFMQRVNAALPTGFSVSMATEIAQNPNIAGRAVAAEYHVRAQGDQGDLEKMLAGAGALVLPGGEQVGEKLLAAAPMAGGAKLLAACGNTNLRLDRFLEAFNARWGTALGLSDCCKVALYLSPEEGEGMLNADALFTC